MFNPVLDMILKQKRGKRPSKKQHQSGDDDRNNNDDDGSGNGKSSVSVSVNVGTIVAGSRESGRCDIILM